MAFKNLTETLETLGELVRDQYKAQLQKGNSMATGKLYNSIGYQLTFTDKGVKLYFKALDYWIYVENGRQSGSMPPISVIKQWMVSKGIPENNGTAWKIARSIKEHGIAEKPYLRQIKQQLPSFKDDIMAALGKDLKIEMKEQMKNKKQEIKL